MPSLTAANIARIDMALSKVCKFSEGTMTLRKQIEVYTTGFITHEEPSIQFNRVKFNRMNSKEQAEYERKLEKKVTKYYATKQDGYIIPIPKIVYDWMLAQ